MLKFIVLPVLGLLILNVPGIILGIILAFILDNTKEAKKKRVQKEDEAADKIIEGIDNFTETVNGWTARIQADTDRRKQKKIDKARMKYEKRIAKMNKHS